MLKQNLVRIIALALIVFITCTDSFADIRIRFARGRTSATMAGSIRKGGRICYVAGARNGQTMTAAVSSKSGKVVFLENGETSYTLYIEITGDQTVCLDNLRGSTTYTLTVSIR